MSLKSTNLEILVLDFCVKTAVQSVSSDSGVGESFKQLLKTELRDSPVPGIRVCQLVGRKILEAAAIAFYKMIRTGDV